ncbi:MAG: hypothetical protein WEB58_12380 [Planctomycetaceae bacterium]
MTSPPSWLSKLSNLIASEIAPVDLMAPIGCHFFHEPLTDEWEISLFASSTEIVGGEFDGIAHPSKFTVDIAAVMKCFDKVERVHWQNLPIADDDELGPHLSFEGLFDGYNVWVRILAAAPAQFSHGRRLSVYEMKIEDLW